MAFRFEHLDIWKDSNLFISKIYKATKEFPRDELFSLTNQLRRSAGSISANIAEGAGSSSDKDFSHYLDIAIKSLYETVAHLYLAKEQKYISERLRKQFYNDAEVLVKRIQSFKKWLNKSHKP